MEEKGKKTKKKSKMDSWMKISIYCKFFGSIILFVWEFIWCLINLSRSGFVNFSAPQESPQADEIILIILSQDISGAFYFCEALSQFRWRIFSLVFSRSSSYRLAYPHKVWLHRAISLSNPLNCAVHSTNHLQYIASVSTKKIIPENI